MSGRYEPDATATALAEARAELKRVMPVYRAVKRCVDRNGFIFQVDEGRVIVNQKAMRALEEAFARAERKKGKK